VPKAERTGGDHEMLQTNGLVDHDCSVNLTRPLFLPFEITLIGKRALTKNVIDPAIECM
jgi:hypothetical protein